MLRSIGLLAVVCAVAGSTARARAGGEMHFAPDPRAEQREARWRKNPRASLPEMVKTICRRGGSESVAVDILGDLGAPAVPPLLAALARDRDCDDEQATKAVVTVLCEAEKRNGGARVTPAFAQLRAALASSDWARVEAGLGVVSMMGERPPDTPAGVRRQMQFGFGDCAPPESLLAASVEPLGRLLARTRGPHRERVTMAVWATGKHATALAPQLIRLLDDEDARYEAVTALGAIGKPAAPAAAALGRLLATTDNDFRRFSIAYALQEIGPPAAVALPQLRARITEAAAEICKRGPPAYGWYLRAALKIGPPPGTEAAAWNTAIAADVRNALATLRGCDAPDSERKLVELLSELPPSLGTGLLVDVMMDEGRSIARRTPAATALSTAHAVLPPTIAATQNLLLERGKRELWISGQAAQSPSVSDAALGAAMRAVDRCDREGRGLPAERDDKYFSSNGSDAAANDAMEACLRDRLCGPGPEKRARAMAVCCRYAFGRATPAWCNP